MNDHALNKIKSYAANVTGVKRQSSVMLPLIFRQGSWHVLYELRSKNLKTQPGEICFPGGALEKGEHPRITAIRETCEELGVSDADIEVIGQMDSIMTSFDMLIHCYIGILKCSFESIQHSEDEVESIFTVPVDYLLSHTPKVYKAQSKFELDEDFPFQNIPNGKDYNFKTSSYPIVFYQYENHNIWGLTARMTEQFIQIIS